MKRSIALLVLLILPSLVFAGATKFSWDNPAGATGNKFYCGKASRTYDPPVVLTPAVTTYTITLPGGSTGARFFCAVTATNAVGESGFSNEVAVDVAAEQPPAAPTNFRVTMSVTYDPSKDKITAQITSIQRVR